MTRYFLKRFLLTLPALWLVLTLVFLMIHIVPGDPVEQMLGEGAAPGQVSQLRHSLGLDLPLHSQYGHYLRQLVRGDLGQSFKFQAPPLFNSRFSHLSFARPSPSPRVCLPLIAEDKSPIVPSVFSLSSAWHFQTSLWARC